MSHQVVGYEHDERVSADRNKIKEVIANEPPTCPYWCVTNPFAQDVAWLHSIREFGTHLSFVGGHGEAPYELTQYLALFEQAHSATRAHYDRIDRERRERERESQRKHAKAGRR